MSDFDNPYAAPTTTAEPNVVYGKADPLDRIPFDAEEMRLISDVGRLMAIAGALTIATGLIDAVREFMAEKYVEGAVEMFMLIAVGVTTFLAGQSFSQVGSSDKDQQKRLVDGISKLRIAYMTKGILFLLVTFLFLAAVGLGFSSAF